MRRKGKPYTVTQVQSHTGVIHEKSILNRVATKRVTSVQKLPKDAKQVFNIDKDSETKTASTCDHRLKGADWAKMTRSRPNVSFWIPQPPGLIRRLRITLCHVQKLKQLSYAVHWHGYGPQEYTVESAAHMPQHFINRYWRRKRRTQ